MADVIALGPQDTLDDLLAKIAARRDRALVLWAPRGTPLLRQMEDFQALKDALRRSHAELKILSADPRIVGLALVFGFAAEIAATPPAEARSEGRSDSTVDLPVPGRESARPPIPADGGAVHIVLPSRPATPPLSRAPAPPAPSATMPAAPPSGAPSGPSADTEWLLSEDLDLAAILEQEDQAHERSAQPPPEVLADLAAAGRAPGVVTPPAGPRVPPVASPPAAGPPSLGVAPVVPAPAPAPHAPAVAGPNAAEDSRAVSFAEWLAMEAGGAGAARPAAGPPPNIDLTRLPAWLRQSLGAAEPPPPAPPAAHQPDHPSATPGAARPAAGPLFSPEPAAAPRPPAAGVPLRCPHCGEELDKEQMLRLLAEVWGL